ncbi:MAG: zinc-binding dehydrogenase, partial [Maribacter sp.]
FTTEKVADYTAKYTDGGFDVIFDTVGGPNLTNSMEAIALNGHISTTVSLLEIDLTPLHFKGASLHVVFMLIPMLHNFKRAKHAEILEKLAKISNEGHLMPVLDENQFSLEQVGDAYAHLASGTAIGKVVVEN